MYKPPRENTWLIIMNAEIENKLHPALAENSRGGQHKEGSIKEGSIKEGSIKAAPTSPKNLPVTVEGEHPHSSSLHDTLLDNDCQAHPLMDCTIDVVGSRCGKWPNLNAIAIDLYIVDRRCGGFFSRLGHAILPGAVC